MASNYEKLTPRRGSTVIWAAVKKGHGVKMPLVPANMRFPGKKVRLLRGMLEAVSQDGSRCKIADDRGPTFWVDCDALLFKPERLD